MATKKLGDDLPSKAVDAYKVWVQANGFVQWKLSLAAIGLIQRIPYELQRRAVLGDWDYVAEWFERANAAWMFVEGMEKLDRVGVRVRPKRAASTGTDGGKRQ